LVAGTLSEQVLQDAVSAFEAALGDQLVAAFALGSLAHGGFSELVSDVDLGLVFTDDISDADVDTIEVVTSTVRDAGTELHRRLSVFWARLSTLRDGTEGGRFPPLDRLDLIEHGRLLLGDDCREEMSRPSRDELLVMGATFALDFLAGEPTAPGVGRAGLGSMSPGDDSVTRQLRDPALLVAQGPRRLTKLVLFPVRFLYTAQTGNVGTIGAAVEHFMTDPGAPAKPLVQAATSWREVEPDSDGAELLVRSDLIPLYLYLISDHEKRLSDLGRQDLVRRYAEWRDRLTA
jgi:hypothetical protein